MNHLELIHLQTEKSMILTIRLYLYYLRRLFFSPISKAFSFYLLKAACVFFLGRLFFFFLSLDLAIIIYVI